MPKEKVEVLVEGGKATAAPPLGPALGPMGVNIGQVVSDINKKTSSFQGMQVPVKIFIDKETKQYEIVIGTPPASGLIKKEANLEKGSGKAKHEMVADILIEQVIKIAKMKETATLGKSLREKVKEVIGTCQSMGILVEGKHAKETLKDIEAGIFDEEIRLEKTELTQEELAKLEVEKKRLAEELAKRKAEFEKLAKEIIAQMAGKSRGETKAKLVQAGIPDEMIKELLPVEGAATPGAEAKPGAAAPAAGAAAAAGAKKEAPKKEEKKK
ncbi:50S ribosomal protein L11 [Candidatus Woesearchaeota archaeon]|nr:50S ribosomal protein L11 [Candidatus Woesearchaeota archaeon]